VAARVNNIISARNKLRFTKIYNQIYLHTPQKMNSNNRGGRGGGRGGGKRHDNPNV